MGRVCHLCHCLTQQGSQGNHWFHTPQCQISRPIFLSWHDEWRIWIHLGVFTDQTCTKSTPSGTYEKYNYYGNSLPYSTESIVKNDCISCNEPQNKDDNNQGDYYDQDQVLEVCEKLYEGSAKCERNLGISNPNIDSCDFINKSLPRMEKALKGGGSAAPVAIFFGLSTILMCSYICYIRDKAKRANVDLSSQGDGNEIQQPTQHRFRKRLHWRRLFSRGRAGDIEWFAFFHVLSTKLNWPITLDDTTPLRNSLIAEDFGISWLAITSKRGLKLSAWHVERLHRSAWKDVAAARGNTYAKIAQVKLTARHIQQNCLNTRSILRVP